jgi:regulator of protease activity HflC (stomatin/prohibitin superfamily)
MEGYLTASILIVVVLLFLIANIKIVPQATVFVIERLGAYYKTWETGLHFKLPFFDRIAKKVSLRQAQINFEDFGACEKDMKNVIHCSGLNNIFYKK